MRIRTQLILASFVLAVLPLAAIVIWSYHSSREALEAAQSRETRRLARQMDRRLASIREELDQRLTVVSALPLQKTNDQGQVGSIVTAMGDVATLVDAVEFQPVAVPVAPPPPATSAPALALAPAPVPAPAPAARAEVAVAVEPPPVVIAIPPSVEFPRFIMPAEQRELIKVISRSATKLSDLNLPAEERAKLERELDEAREKLESVMAESRKEWEAQAREARVANEARREVMRERVRTERRVTVPLPAAVKDLAQVADEAKKVQVAKARPAPKEKKVVPKSTPDKRISLLLGRDFAAPVKKQGEVVGQISARVRPEEVIQRVLGARSEDADEIPFAIDREHNVYTRTPEDKARLDLLGVPRRVREGKPLTDIEGWIVTVTTDRESGLRIGVARPVGEDLTELKKTAGRNFGLGLGLIAFALIGIVPLANHLTRDVQLVTEGAQRIAHGDLMTRLPVESKNEFGQLAMAFNRMAEDLSLQQQRLLEQERTSKEQELQQRLLAVEYERKSFELEEARRFQLSMLPKEVPSHEQYDVAVYTRTATEVGGDYYDFHLAADGTLAVTIGDATGHGAKAGTMVTVVKTLFAGYGGAIEPADFLRDGAERIKRMELGRMSMALALARFAGRTLTLTSAGMPPVLIHRAASNAIDEIAIEATPLGTLGTEYAQTEVEIGAGDTVLFMTDGFPELLNDAGQQFGYAGASEAFATVAGGATADAVIRSLTDIVRRWHGDLPPNDDVTFVAVRVRAV